MKNFRAFAAAAAAGAAIAAVAPGVAQANQVHAVEISRGSRIPARVRAGQPLVLELMGIMSSTDELERVDVSVRPAQNLIVIDAYARTARRGFGIEKGWNARKTIPNLAEGVWKLQFNGAFRLLPWSATVFVEAEVLTSTRSVPFTTIVQEPSGGPMQPQQLVIEDEAAYRAYFNGTPPASPRVDFSREVVLALAAGARGSSGYGIAITKIELQTRGIVSRFATVNYRESKPAPGERVLRVITAPHHVVKLEKLGVRFVFEKDAEQEVTGRVSLLTGRDVAIEVAPSRFLKVANAPFKDILARAAGRRVTAFGRVGNDNLEVEWLAGKATRTLAIYPTPSGGTPAFVPMAAGTPVRVVAASGARWKVRALAGVGGGWVEAAGIAIGEAATAVPSTPGITSTVPR